MENMIYDILKFVIDFSKVILGYFLYKYEINFIYIFLYMFVLPFIDIYIHQLRYSLQDLLQIYLPIMEVMYNISCDLMGKDILAQKEYIHEFFIKVLLFNHADIQFAKKEDILDFFRQPLTVHDNYVVTQCFMEKWCQSLLRYSKQVTDSLEPRSIPYATTTSQPILYSAKSFIYEIFYLEFFDFFFNEKIQILITSENAKILQDEKAKFPIALTRCMESVFENDLNPIDGIYQRPIKLYHTNMELNLYMYSEVEKAFGSYSYKGVLLNYLYNRMFLRQYHHMEMFHILESQPVALDGMQMHKIDWYRYYSRDEALKQAKFSIYKFTEPIYFNENIIYEGGLHYIEWYKPFNYTNGFTADSLDNISPFVIPVMSDEL